MYVVLEEFQFAVFVEVHIVLIMFVNILTHSTYILLATSYSLLHTLLYLCSN